MAEVDAGRLSMMTNREIVRLLGTTADPVLKVLIERVDHLVERTQREGASNSRYASHCRQCGTRHD